MSKKKTKQQISNEAYYAKLERIYELYRQKTGKQSPPLE